MKKYILALAITLSGFAVSAQKFAFIDSEYILQHMPEYTSALTQLDGTSKQWQKVADDNFAEIDRMYKAYQADQVLLTEEMRKQRENDIIEKEKAAKEYQRLKFGPDGELFQMRNKLLEPIQTRVSETVAGIAKSKYIDFVFDRGSEATMMIYANSSYDLSDEVITKLGYKPGTNKN